MKVRRKHLHLLLTRGRRARRANLRETRSISGRPEMSREKGLQRSWATG
jgi:hypothetical protein